MGLFVVLPSSWWLCGLQWQPLWVCHLLEISQDWALRLTDTLCSHWSPLFSALRSLGVCSSDFFLLLIWDFVCSSGFVRTEFRLFTWGISFLLACSFRAASSPFSVVLAAHQGVRWALLPLLFDVLSPPRLPLSFTVSACTVESSSAHRFSCYFLLIMTSWNWLW